ncbi:hypothetical protein [Piscinibacter sp.]|uniref:hypothetical protein n=1 Tax=Piscinibacter sp. TaxID=1903157 RepID=UPI002C28B795|nr:hypothetical protein [Albitalea sp.]HUG21064.1 hypothetical protein [Albitalea sp.]
MHRAVDDSRDFDAAQVTRLERLAPHLRQACELTHELHDDNLIRVQVAKGRPERARHLAQECLPLVRGQKVGVDLLEASVGLAACLAEHERGARFWGAADKKSSDFSAACLIHLCTASRVAAVIPTRACAVRLVRRPLRPQVRRTAAE